MRARRLQDVRELLESSPFREWWGALEVARLTLATAEERREDLEASTQLLELRAELLHAQATQAFYRAGEHTERAARWTAEAERLENDGFPGVAQYEDQRFAVSELWYRLGAAETALEQARAGGKGDILALERQRQQLAAEYTRQEAKKTQLWSDVERLWATSAEAGLRASEELALSRREKRHAEQGFERANEQKARVVAARGLLVQAREKATAAATALERLQQSASERFGCAVGTDFLFFRHPADTRHAWAVGLVKDAEHYNIEVQPLGVYLVERRRGVGFLEPARVPVPEADDKRFEDYFLTGRRGQPRVSGA